MQSTDKESPPKSAPSPSRNPSGDELLRLARAAARRPAPSPAECEDLAQDVIVEYLRARRTSARPTAVFAWLCRVARRLTWQRGQAVARRDDIPVEQIADPKGLSAWHALDTGWTRLVGLRRAGLDAIEPRLLATLTGDLTRAYRSLRGNEQRWPLACSRPK